MKCQTESNQQSNPFPLIFQIQAQKLLWRAPNRWHMIEDNDPDRINEVEQKYGQQTRENPSIITVIQSFKFHLESKEVNLTTPR